MRTVGSLDSRVSRWVDTWKISMVSRIGEWVCEWVDGWVYDCWLGW